LKLELVDRPCPICGSADRSRVRAKAHFDPARLDAFAFSSRKLPEYMHHQLMVCGDCQLLYSSPIPSHDSLAVAYHEAAFDSADESAHASRTYARLVATMVLPALSDKQSALDIGTGDGSFLSRLLELGFENVAGVEPSAAPIAAAASKVRPLIRHKGFVRSDFAERSLSLVTCFQTLEHLSDPLALAKDALALLKPGGAALFVCHNRLALSARVMGLKSPIFDIEHLQLFSPPSARRMLERAGFVKLQTRTVVNRYPLRYWLRLLPVPGLLKPATLRAVNGAGLGGLPISLPAGNFAIVGLAP
jgi:SAM-dependent methyltransferase